MAIDFNQINQILNYNFWNNSLKEYLIALVVFILSLIILKIFKTIFLNKLKKIINHTIADTDFNDLTIKTIDSIGWPFYFFLSLYFSLKFLNLPSILTTLVYYLLLIIGVYYIVNGIQNIADYGFRKVIKKRKSEKGFDPSVINLLQKITRIALWGIALIILLQNLGYNISTLVAGLGIGGLAIAFALQNILTDIFASFSIYFDKPFQIGDFIILGKDMGTVKKIGLKTTRIQTLQGEELIVSNKELTESRIHNYKKMAKRRIVFNFGVVYETPTEKVKKIPEIVKSIIDKIDLAEIDRVHFSKFGNSSLDFEVVYYLNSSEYNQYMDTQEQINLTVKQEFEKENIQFAYPTQTIFINKT